MQPVKEGEHLMAIICKEIDLGQPVTEEQKRMLEKAAAMPREADADCPECSEEMLKRAEKVRNN